MSTTAYIKNEVTDSNNNILYSIHATISGDGATPMIKTMMGSKVPVGYADDGMPIYQEIDEKDVQSEEQKFMALTIKLQKAFSEYNGLNPDVVNIIGDESK